MSNASQIEAVRREVVLAGQRWFSPEANRTLFVAEARKLLAEVDAKNAAVVGPGIGHSTMVDGVASEDIAGAKARIVRTYQLVPLALTAIGRLLWTHSPYRRGRYRNSHRLLADGVQVSVVSGADWGAPPIPEGVRELWFVPTVVYAKSIERGRSKQAPDGVYQVVAQLSRGVYGKFAQVSFGYRSVTVSGGKKSGERNQPAIIIRPR